MDSQVGATNRQNDFSAAFEFSNKYLSQAITIIREQIPKSMVVDVAPVEDDLKRAADIKIVGVPGTVGLRVRHLVNPTTGLPYYDKYGDEFTIRASRNGHETEWDKVIGPNEYMDWMLYAFVEEELGLIRYYTLIDMDVFRREWRMHRHTIPCVMGKPNGDGTAFNAFKVRSFSPELVIYTNNPKHRHA